MTGNLPGGIPHEEGGVPQPPAPPSSSTEQPQTPPAPPTPAAPAAPPIPSAPAAPAAPAAPTAASSAPTPPVPPAAVPTPPAAPAPSAPPAPPAVKAETPTVPPTPAAPSTPSAPGSHTPAVPPVPQTPQTQAPAAPTAPATPKVPSAPSAPSVPNAPSIPGAPAAPGAAKPPSVPTAPGTPGVPQAAAQTQQVEPKGSSNQEPQKAHATQSNAQKTDDQRYGLFTLKQWIGGGILVILGLAFILAAAVFASRYFFSTEFGADFLNRYDGHSSLPENAPVGIPAWLGWQHFFNLFFMVLIIRTGLQIRYERKPSAYVTPRLSKKKISLTMWFHLSLDILWVANGLIFIILLFVTGHWMRIVPTSWDVFPNALSAGLQFLTLDWPTENGWVNYNALQLLTYFTTVFIAAPLAIISGFRLSSFWSKKWTRASQLPPPIHCFSV